jgi:hypothetical protein
VFPRQLKPASRHRGHFQIEGVQVAGHGELVEFPSKFCVVLDAFQELPLIRRVGWYPGHSIFSPAVTVEQPIGVTDIGRGAAPWAFSKRNQNDLKESIAFLKQLSQLNGEESRLAEGAEPPNIFFFCNVHKSWQMGAWIRATTL